MDYNIIERLKVIQSILEDETTNQWMTIKDVCNYTRLSPSTIRRATQRGNLKVSKMTGKNLFKKAWVDNFLGVS